MNTTASPAFDQFFGSLVPESPQTSPGLTIIPLTSTLVPRLVYLPMGVALARDLIEITEISEGGSVPNLAVINRGDDPVLLLSGEEVAGAKQNRIFNTTILVDARSKTHVPVSCTEAGRWGYRSRKFSDSGHIAPRTVRAPKAESVHRSLKARLRHDSDQGEVWDNVASYQLKAHFLSDTSALRDSLEFQRIDLAKVIHNLPLVPDQVGLIAVAADGFVGIDAVSRPDVYATLHDKLVRSYMSDVFDKTAEINLTGQVDAFMGWIRSAERGVFDAPGLGSDLRFEGERATGSALSHADEIVHLAGFTRMNAV